MYISALSLTLALYGGRLSMPCPCHFPLYRRVGGPQGRFGRVRKISPPLGFDPRTVQPVASRYTDCVILTRCMKLTVENRFLHFICPGCKMSVALQVKRYVEDSVRLGS